MNWTYAYSPTIWPSAFTIILLIALFVYAWYRRSVPGALPFMVACGFAALWAVGSVIEHAAVDLDAKIFWIKFQSFWQPPLVASVTCFLLEYAWPGRWLNRRNLSLFSIPPLLINGMILTDHLHHLAWYSFTFNGVVQPQVGPVGWIAYAYAFGVLGALNLLVFGWLFLHSPLQRWPVALMLVGQIGGRLLYLLERFNLLHSILPIDMLGMAFEFLIYALALFGFHILDPIPMARRTVIEQLQAGMLVLDPRGKIVSLNPAAGAILGSPVRRLLGRPIQELLPAYSLKTAEVPLETEVSLGSGPESRVYRMEVSTLNDWRGLEAGRLLMLRDVTDQKRTQAMLLEQQRALAMMGEREQLARELHDSLGQTIAFVNTQGQTILRLLNRGDIATADEYTRRLVEVARTADVDIRESILGLRIALSGQGFFPVLAQYLAQYEKTYGIQTGLEKPETIPGEAFEPLVEAQLLRILQEALSNVRKHACADRVRIDFSFEDSYARVTVQDDGKGFDPGTQSDPYSEHIGLRVMRERAEEVGGRVELSSIPGQGTCVVVEVPLKRDAVEDEHGEVGTGRQRTSTHTRGKKDMETRCP